MAEVLRPRAAAAIAPPRRRGLHRAAAVLAAAPLVASALLSSSGLLRLGAPAAGAPPAPLAAAAETMVFVALPGGCLGVLRAGPEAVASTSRVARAAGYEDKPGGRPVLDGEEPPVEVEKDLKPWTLKTGEETLRMQHDRKSKRAVWLKSLKGKFVPYGPKPWDKHRFTKVCIQTRLEAKQASNTKIINQVVEEIRRISGRHPRVVKSRKNIAAFGWRKGANCGVAVQLQGQKMMDFLTRLNTLILPRVRDFEGLYPSSVDSWGNFWMGFDNQEPFRELDELIDSRELVHGFDVGIINNCFTQPDGLKLMKDFGFPFGDPRPPKPPKEPWWMRNMKASKKKAAAKKKR